MAVPRSALYVRLRQAHRTLPESRGSQGLTRSGRSEGFTRTIEGDPERTFIPEMTGAIQVALGQYFLQSHWDSYEAMMLEIAFD